MEMKDKYGWVVMFYNDYEHRNQVDAIGMYLTKETLKTNIRKLLRETIESEEESCAKKYHLTLKQAVDELIEGEMIEIFSKTFVVSLTKIYEKKY